MRHPLSLGPPLRQAVAPLFVAVAIVLVLLPLSPPYDLQVFLRAGHAVLHDLQVYPPPGSPAAYSGHSFVYPYFAVWPFVPLAMMSPGLSTALFFALSIGAMLAACVAAAGGDTRPAALVMCSSFAITGLQLGALSPLLCAGAVFLWRLRDRPAGFAVLAAAVVVSKLFLAPLLVWPLLARAACVRLRTALTLGSSRWVSCGPPPDRRPRSGPVRLGAHEA